MSTIESVFDPKRNSLNALRLLLAVSVIVSHSFAIGMFGPEPQVGGTKLGTWAVLGFFAVSGFLITGSRLSGKPVLGYYVNRVLRIFPGFIVCLMIIALVLAPLSVLLDPRASWSIVDSITYILRNFFLYPPELAQPAIGGTLQHVPYQGYWNGSMWTLFWEFGCYVLIGVAGSVSRRWLPAVVWVIFVLATALSILVDVGVIDLPDVAGWALPLLAAFMAGSLAYLYRSKIQFNGLTLCASVAMTSVASIFGLAHSLAAAPLAILILWLGSVLPLTWIGSNGRPDLSYGMYIYAWPIQQYIMLVFGQALGAPLMIALSIFLTLPLAYLSFRYVERPAQRRGHAWIKSRMSRRESGRPESNDFVRG
jgi:peptidoglycan/LPS O-acetylase OafA/YrhL